MTRLRRAVTALTVLAVLSAVIATVLDASPDARVTRGWQGFGGSAWPPASWRPYDDRAPHNRLIGADAVHPRSRAIARRTLSWGLPPNLLAGTGETGADYDHPIYFARSSDPISTLASTQPWGRNSIDGHRIRIPRGARPATGTDGHMTVVQPDGWEYDMWRVRGRPRPGAVLRFGWGGRLRIDGDGRGGGATAADLGLAAGIIRAPELRSGRIDHALALVVRCTSADVSFGFGVRSARRGDRGSSFVYPAGKGARPCRGEPDAPPTGARFRLRFTRAELAALRVPTWKRGILRALSRYGAYVTDTGGSGFGLLMESGASYTALGFPDPFVGVARRAGHPRDPAGLYALDVASGIDWAGRLEVVVPPARG